MSQVEERMQTQQGKLVGGSATVGPSGRPPATSPYGRKVESSTSSGPVVSSDPELEAQRQAHNARIAAEAEEARKNATFGSVDEARKAIELLQANEGSWSKERLEAGWARVKNFIAQNPEAIEQFQKDKELQAWEDTFIDSTPHASSRLRKAQAEAMRQRAAFEGQEDSFTIQKAARDMIPIPKSVKDLSPVDPDSTLGILESEEQKGLDTSSGYGGLGDAISAATEFNSPQARAAWLHATTMDKIEAAGIPLPEGVKPVRLNEELGRLEYLNPTADGKLRRTLVESEFFRAADVGKAADLPELFSMITAGIAAASGPAGRHPLVTEFAGDLVGRNLGIMAEYLLSNQAISPEEFQSAMVGSLGDAAVATALSRITARTVQGASNLGNIRTSGSTRPGAAEATAKEAAQAVEDINRINAGTDAPAMSIERGSLSLRESQIARGREKTLSSKAAEGLEDIRTERIEALSRANQRIAETAGAAPGPTDPINVQTLNKRINERGTIVIDPPYPVSPGVESRRYSFANDTDAVPGPGGRAGDPGVQMFLDHNRGVATIENVFAGSQSQGLTYDLMERMLEDIPADYSIRSSGSVTRQGQKIVERLNKSGWKIQLREGTAMDEKTGELINLDGGGVYEVIARPGQIVAPDSVARAQYSKAALEGDLEAVLDTVPALESMANDAQGYLHGTIGWSPQRHTSKYSVENKSRSGVSQTVRRINNRIEQALTGTEASQAQRTLVAAIRREADEDGETFLSGLAAEELDLGNLINAREAVARVAARTKDPDMVRLVTDIDNLLKNAPIYTEKGNRIAASTRSNIYSAITEVRETNALLEEQVARINGSRIFAQGPDGSFLNTSLKGMRAILGNDAQYIKQMKPILDSTPGLQARAVEALNTIYKADVLDKGWTAARHQAFLSKYGEAASDLMNPEDLKTLTDLRPPTGGVGRMQQIIQRKKEAWNQMSERLGTADVNPDNILGSLRNVSPERVRSFMWYADRTDPVLAGAVRRDMAAQIRNELHQGFFDTKRGVDNIKSGFQLKDWWTADNNARQRTVRAVMGDQYTKDLGTIVEAAAIDAQRAASKGYRPETQGDVIRVTRSLLGPLSRPQRQITAFNYVRQRALAARVLKVMTEPEQLRALVEAGRLPARSKQGIAILARVGIFEAAGIVDPENNIEEVMAFYDQIEEWARAGLEDKEATSE